MQSCDIIKGAQHGGNSSPNADSERINVHVIMDQR